MNVQQRNATVKAVYLYKNEKKFAQFGPLEDTEAEALVKQIEESIGENVELVSHTKATPLDLSHTDSPEETIVYTDGRSTYQISIHRSEISIH